MTTFSLTDVIPPVSDSPPGTLDRAQLRSHIISVAHFIAGRKGADWLVHEPDPFWFIVYFYGIIFGGGNAMVLPDVRTGTLDSLGATYCGQLGSHAVVDGHVPSRTIFSADYTPDFLDSVPTGNVTVLTSGSTGSRKHLTRSLRQLLAEASTLQDKWPTSEKLVNGSTVSHHHMYGLMFGVVWPLRYGAHVLAAVQSPVPDFANLDNSAGRRIRLVSSPSYLHRMNDSMGLANFDDALEQTVEIDCVFSAGSPLDPQKAAAVSRLLECPVHEIYGSSETGAVAARRGELNGPWKALPGVNLKIDAQRLVVDCDYLAREVPRPYTSADAAEPVAGGFRLLGRTDRIAKVEGKRVSLHQVEHLIRRLDWASEAAAVVLSESRDSIAVAVVLNDPGMTLLLGHGKAELDKLLRRSLANDLDAVAAPKRIRYMAALPVDSQGKLNQEILRAAFNTHGRMEPCIHAVTRRDNDVELDLALDPDLLAFEGHFPRCPILPGVALLHWVMLFTRRFFDAETSARELTNLKFMHILVPNDRLRLALSHDEGQVKYQYTCAGKLCAKGRIKTHE